MRTNIVKIRNAHYVILPDRALEQAGIVDKVSIEIEDGTLVIKPIIISTKNKTTTARTTKRS